MRNVCTKEDLKSTIQKREKNENKKQEISNVIRMFVLCMTDILYRFDNDTTQIEEITQEMETLRLYTNNCFLNISKSYKCVSLFYDQTFNLDTIQRKTLHKLL